MTTPKMVEAIARALFDGRPHCNFIKSVRQVPDWELQPDHLKDVFRRDALAALKALQSPTEEMVWIGGRIVAGLSSGRATEVYEDDARNAWQDMITEAMK